MSKVILFIKKYWIEITVFTLIFGGILLDLAPSYTWINTCSDGIHYDYAAKYLYPSHKSSSPLYLLIGHLFTMLPIGTEFWRLALLSWISSCITVIFIYKIIRTLTTEKKYSKWYAIIGILVYGGSALVLSQSSIVETYTFVTMLCVIAYWFSIKKQWKLTALFIGMILATHPVGWLEAIVLFVANKELRRWKPIVIMASFMLLYLYIPITNRPPYMWNQANSEGGIFGFVKDLWSTSVMLTGTLSIYDLPKRILETLWQFVIDWNLGIVGIVVWLASVGKKWYKNILVWLIFLPIIYYVVDLAPQTYVYMLPGIAFGCIAAGIGFAKFESVHIKDTQQKIAIGASCLIILAIGVYNVNYFDIGRTLDKNLGATQFYKVELDKVPDGAVLIPSKSWEWAAIYKYNKDNGRNIIPICAETTSSEVTQKYMDGIGVKYELPPKNMDRGLWNDYVSRSVLLNNDNIYTTITTEPKTYSGEVVKASDIRAVNNFISNTKVEFNTWQWMPANPYDITTGAIEVEQWQWIVMTNRNCLFFGVLAAVCYVIVWILWQIIIKKKSWSLNKAKDSIKEKI